MNSARLIALLLALGLATSACAGQPPPLRCRHALATVGQAGDMPASVVGQLRPWMALHGERWNRTDSIRQGDLTAGFLWAAQWNGDWIVAYSVGGEACCRTRFGLFAPAGPGSAIYHQVIPPAGRPDYFGDATCKGIDAALSAYGGHR